MNPEAEFIRGLRERLDLRRSGYEYAAKNARDRREWDLSAMWDGHASACKEVLVELNEYLKTKGIE